ncbi:MAG: hypothetical protein JWQ77_4091 [Jatrophihabitans sp.]|nr:hypothetical protein [Jatrophihabitans sp.]
MKTWVFVVGSVAICLLTSCSSSGGQSSPPTRTSLSSSASPSSGPVPTRSELLADLLQPGDLPSSWRATKHDASDDSSDAADQAADAACLNARNTYSDQLVDVHSPDYDETSGSSITSEATSFRSSADVDSDAKMFADPKASACYMSVARKDAASGLPAGYKLDGVDIKVKPGTNGGPANEVALITGTVTLTAQGVNVVTYDSTVALRGNMTEFSIDFVGVGAPVSAAVQRATVDKVSSRIAHGG